MTTDNLFSSLEKQLLGRTVGMDSFFRGLRETSNVTNQSYPPYNVEKISDNEYNIVIALAGFSKDEIIITQEKNILKIEAEIENNDQDRDYVYKGIARRSFKRQFTLAEYIKVVDASMENGLLTITLEKEVPKADQPKLISIS